MTTIDLVPDQLWNVIQPLLPPEPPKPKGGRPRIPDRAVAGAIIFMLRAGLPWRLLPARELVAGSPVNCWRRLRDWQRAGVWQQLHAALINELGRADQIDWSRVCLDTLSVRAKRGRRADGPQPHRPWQAGLQVPSGCRPVGHPACSGVVSGQHP